MDRDRFDLPDFSKNNLTQVNGKNWNGGWENLTVLLSISELFFKSQCLFLPGVDDWKFKKEAQIFLCLGTISLIDSDSLLLCLSRMMVITRLLSRWIYWLGRTDNPSFTYILGVEIESLKKNPKSWDT